MTFDILDMLLVFVFGVCIGLGTLAWCIGAFGCYTDCHLGPGNCKKSQESQET